MGGRAAIVAIALLISAPVHGAPRSCGAAKLEIVAEVVAETLTCQSEAAASGLSVDAACLAAVDAALADGFLEVEADGGCSLTAGTAAATVEIDGLVTAAVAMLRPVQAANACSASKLAATAIAASERLTAQRRAEGRGTDVKARAVEHGRLQLAERFAQAEGSSTCASSGDAAAINALLDDRGERIAGLLRPTRRMSVSSRGKAAHRPSIEDRISSTHADLSADGRVVVFFSNAEDLVRGDENHRDIFDVLVHDVVAGTTELANISDSGEQADSDPLSYPAISADGRYVAFDSWATTLVPGDTNVRPDVFVRDRVLGTTTRVSVDSDGTEGNGYSTNPALSPDGRYVGFSSTASNLVVGDTNLWSDVFVHDRMTGTTERVSLAADGSEGDQPSFSPSFSADAQLVAFWSTANNLVPGDGGDTTDVFIVDRSTHAIEWVSVPWNGVPGLNPGPYSRPGMSADGRFVAFGGGGDGIVPGDQNGVGDVFVRDRVLGTTERVSVGLGGGDANGQSIFASISADGRFVAFESEASNLVPGDMNGVADVFVADRTTGTIVRASLAFDGSEGNDFSSQPALSADGRRLAYWGKASNLVRNDRTGKFLGFDVFLRSLDWP